MVDGLAKGDRSKWEFYFEMNIIAFFNTVVYYMDKSEYEKELRRGN